MHGLEAKYGACIDFVYLDIDNPATEDAKSRYGFQAQPLILLLDGSGKMVWKKFGVVTQEELEARLQALVKQ